MGVGNIINVSTVVKFKVPRNKTLPIIPVLQYIYSSHDKKAWASKIDS